MSAFVARCALSARKGVWFSLPWCSILSAPPFGRVLCGTTPSFFFLNPRQSSIIFLYTAHERQRQRNSESRKQQGSSTPRAILCPLLRLSLIASLFSFSLTWTKSPGSSSSGRGRGAGGLVEFALHPPPLAPAAAAHRPHRPPPPPCGGSRPDAAGHLQERLPPLLAVCAAAVVEWKASDSTIRQRPCCLSGDSCPRVCSKRAHGSTAWECQPVLAELK